MLAIVFFAATITSLVIFHQARPVKGYADFYWIPFKNTRGITIQLLPVRAITFTSSIMCFFSFLIAVWSMIF